MLMGTPYLQTSGWNGNTSQKFRPGSELSSGRSGKPFLRFLTYGGGGGANGDALPLNQRVEREYLPEVLTRFGAVLR